MTSAIERKLRNREPVEIDGVRITRPTRFDTSETGSFIVMDEGEVEDVSCSIHVFDRDRTETFRNEYPAAGSACALRPDGRYAAFATLKPDNRIYAVDAGSGDLLWSREHYRSRTGRTRRPPVTGLSFHRGRIVIHARGMVAYRLNISGSLVDSDRREKERFQSLDEGEERGFEQVVAYLESDDPERNLRALIEVDVRLDEPIIQNNLDRLTDPVGQMLSRHRLYTLDLTESDTDESRQKLMSTGKRILFEAGRQEPELIEPHLPMIQQHLQNQPPEAAGSDLDLLEEILPAGMFDEIDADADRTPGNQSLVERIQQDQFLDEDTKKQAIEKLEQNGGRSGCGCAGLLLLGLTTAAGGGVLLLVIFP